MEKLQSLKPINIGGLSLCNNTQATQRAFCNNCKSDSFALNTKRVNPAVSNPLYNIPDEFLAEKFPKLLIDKYTNQAYSLNVATSNPAISEILNEAGAPLGIYPQNIKDSIDSHFIPSAKVSQKIMEKCNHNFSDRDYSTMLQASLLHDVGKVYIPDRILNKNGKLDPSERKVIDTHARLGYEALKSGGVSTPVLTLVKGHHNYNKAGADMPMVQILEIADVYSALKEDRPYKKSFSDDKTFEILYNMADSGEFEHQYIDALKRAV